MNKLIGRGRLPKHENLNKLTTKQLQNVLHRFGINGTEIQAQLFREWSKPASQIAALKRQGIKPDSAMMNRLHGQIKRIRSTLERRMVGKAIQEFQEEKTRIQWEKKLSKRIWIWICAFKRSCESCIPRHNVVKSYNEWKRYGMPKSDVLICDGYCNCNVYPREDLEKKKIAKSPKELDEPRTRQRTKKEVKQIKQEIQQGKLFKNKLEQKLKNIESKNKKQALIIDYLANGKISEGQAEVLIKKYLK